MFLCSFIRFHSMQSWTATKRWEVTRKRRKGWRGYKKSVYNQPKEKKCLLWPLNWHQYSTIANAQHVLKKACLPLQKIVKIKFFLNSYHKNCVVQNHSKDFDLSSFSYNVVGVQVYYIRSRCHEHQIH